MIVKTDVSFAALTFISSPAQYNLISVKAFIHQPGMYDIEIKKGHTFRYDIWFGGEPAPSCEWMRNGRTLTSDENTSVELYSKNTIYTERNTVMSIPKVSII